MTYGPVWVDLQGTSIQAEELPILRHKNTGAVILFSKNFASKSQIIQLVQDIRSAADKDILIGVDHEGGRIWRFTEGFTRPQPAQEFGNLYQHDPALALQELRAAGEVIAQELVACDIDLTFAPVLDINHGVSEVIGNRSYGPDPNIVATCARAFIEGLKSAGMGAIGKHFPGHGGCSMDSHFAMAVDERTLDEISNCDLIPFKELSAMLTGVMPAHVIYPQVDAQPAGFSKFWLQEILRGQLGFKGAIISDCLSMHGSGVTDKMVQGAEMALSAGCDMVIASQQTREYLLQVLDQLDWQMSAAQQARIQGLAAQSLMHIHAI